MKILIVGGNKPWAIERFYIKYLREFGAQVDLYAAADMVFDKASASFISKVLFKTKIRTGYKEVNEGLLKQAEALTPDVIWVFKGMEIYPETLDRLRSKYLLANYNPDHPFIVDHSGSGNANVKQSVGKYQLHFCYSKELQRQIGRQYHVPTVFLPFGFNLSEEDFILAQVEVEINKVCFLGNPDKTREGMIRLLAENGIQVDVYGHGWDKTGLNKQQSITVYDAVYGIKFWKRMRQYRVQLNIFRRHNRGSHNMRSFEIPAVGGIQLAPYSNEQADFFKEGKEIFFYRNDADLINGVKKLLLLKPEEAEFVRLAARARSLQSHYSYKDRAKTVFDSFHSRIING